MAGSKRRAILASTLILLLLLGIAVAIACQKVTVVQTSAATLEFDVPESTPRVRKIFVRSNATQDLVAMSDATLLAQDWTDLKLGIEGRLLDRDWKLDGGGTIVVKFRDDYLGEHELTMKQTVHVEPNALTSLTELKEVNSPVQTYRNEITLQPNASGGTRVSLDLSLQVQTKALRIAQAEVKRQIKASAASSVEGQKSAILALIKKHDGQLMILPQLGK